MTTSLGTTRAWTFARGWRSARCVGAISVSLSYFPPQQGHHQHFTTGAFFEAKARAPKRAFALYWALGAVAEEWSNITGGVSDRIDLVGGGSAELQLAHRLAAFFMLRLYVPVHHSGVFDGKTRFSDPGLGLELNLDSYDVWVSLDSLGFVQTSNGTPFVWGGSVGVSVRFGD